MSGFNQYLKPKNGKVFKVLAFGRISTEHQDEKSLDDQEQLVRQHLSRIMPDAEFEIRTIAGQGSGQYLDREEFIELSNLVGTGEYDIVIAEDLARILRRMQAFIFCEEAEDTATRVITINDFLDTKDDNWRQTAFFAAYKHTSSCADTSRRIRRSHRNRFMNGEIVLEMQYGYIKPHPKATDEEVYKDPDAVEVYETWFAMLEAGATYAEVARWLNKSGVPVDPPKRKKRKNRSKKWTVAMVRRLTYNPILKGERHRNKKKSVRVNKTGRAKSVDAPPEELLIRKVPHLKYIGPERWDRLIRELDKRNRKYRRSKEKKNDPRSGIPKRRTRWPGQHIRCGVCGRLFVFGGHGKKDRMMCSGVRDYNCWNAMSIDAPQVAELVVGEIRELVRGLPSFDSDWSSEYEKQRVMRQFDQDAELGEIAKQLTSGEKILENYLSALAQLGSSPAIVKKIKLCEAEVESLRDRKFELEQESGKREELPSLDEITAVADESLNTVAIESEEFGRLLKSIVTEFFVLPYQLVDGGNVQPRIAFRVCLAPLVGHSDLELLSFDRIVDLVKNPQRARILTQVVKLISAGKKHADVAEELGVFKTEVSNAMCLHRKMQKLGIDDPWVPVTNAKQVSSTFKRVRNAQFKFEPLEGFETTKHPKSE